MNRDETFWMYHEDQGWLWTGPEFFDSNDGKKSHLFNYTETEANRSWLYLYESGDFHSYEANATLPKTE